MNIDELIDHLEQVRSEFGSDTKVVLTADDYTPTGVNIDPFIALDQIPLDKDIP